MRRPTLVLLTLMIVAVATLGVGTASAKPRSVTVTLPRVVNIETDSRESGGYLLSVRAERIFPPQRGEGGGNVATLTVRRGHGTATYVPRAVVRGGRVEADFGRFGEIDAHFEPGGPKKTEPLGGCRGGTMVRQRGWIVGTIEFRGERDYTRLIGRRLPGVRFEHPRQTCTFRLPAMPQRDDERKVTVVGVSHRAQSSVGFSAEQDRPGAPTELDAWTEERLGPVSISRSVSVDGRGSALSFDEALSEAEVHPPAPFHGDASFQAFAGKQTGTWLGPLMVSFPGRPDVRLAGRRFRGDLLTGSQCPFEPGASCVGVSFE